MSTGNTLTVQLVGGPTAVLEYGGLRFLTDPALSPPGEYNHLIKETGPAIGPEDIVPIDTVLLSHDQHSDNLDPAGHAFLPRVGNTLTTPAGAERLEGNAIGLQPWSSVELDAPSGSTVTVTAVPALHGPEGAEAESGPVTGFLLAAPGLETVYVSGDNASRDVVREIAERAGPVPIALLFCGAVQLAHRYDGAYLTMSSDHAADATEILGARVVIPVHYEGWAHFTQGAEALRAAFRGNGLADRLALLEPGATASV